MTTTDTDALTERIAESLCEPAHRSRWPLAMITTYCGQCWENATTVAAVVAEEVRKAKAEVLREAAEDLFYDGDNDRPMYGCHELYDRADRIETGDSDEHR